MDYMGLLESQDPLVQRQVTIYSAIMSFIFNSLNSKNKSCPACLKHRYFPNEVMHELGAQSNLPALNMQGERGIPGQQGVQGQPGRSIPGPKVDKIKSHHQTEMKKILYRRQQQKS